MRRFLLLLSALLLFTTSVMASTISVGGITVGTDQVETNLQENSSFISTGDNIKKLQARRIELLSSIKVAQEETIDEIPKRDALVKYTTEIESSLQQWAALDMQRTHLASRANLSPADGLAYKQALDDLAAKESTISGEILALSKVLDIGPFNADTPFTDLQKEFPTMKNVAENAIKNYDVIIDEKQKKKNDTLAASNQELSDVNAEIDRLSLVRHDQIIQLVKQYGGYLLIFLCIYIMKVVSLRFFTRFGTGFSKTHQQAIHLFHRWIFNILFIGAFLVLFAAEFISFLPFLAIFGTAVGLALRDVIYSFIGWFAVGSDSGYLEGDFIEFDETQGRVYRITPLLTSLEEYGKQGFTGKIVSFPNKTIFEKNVKNWSRGSDFSLMSVDFLMTHDTDIERAKEVLTNIASESDLILYYESRHELGTFKNMYGYSDDDIKPQIDVYNDPRGIILRIRVLVHVQDKLREQTRIMESFSKQVQSEPHINFRSV